jgi:hypothetical protein
MPAPSPRPETAKPPDFDELDRVKLKKAIAVEGRDFRSGLAGTIVLCHGHEAYEVEFDSIDDVFGIPAEYLEKI